MSFAHIIFQPGFKMVPGSRICDSELSFTYHDVLHISVSITMEI